MPSRGRPNTVESPLITPHPPPIPYTVWTGYHKGDFWDGNDYDRDGNDC